MNDFKPLKKREFVVYRWHEIHDCINELKKWNGSKYLVIDGMISCSVCKKAPKILKKIDGVPYCHNCWVNEVFGSE